MYVEYGRYSRDLRGKYGVLIQDDKYAKTKIEIEYLLNTLTYLTFTAEAPTVLKQGSYSIGCNTLFGNLQTEANLIYSMNQVVFNLTLSTNIKTNENGVKFSQDENYRQANVEIFAFIDDNSNGIFDPGEKPYPRLKILETHRQKDYETNDKGIAIIPSLDPYERVTLEIVKESISNIFLTAQDFQSDFILTPAQQLKIEIPIKPSFDVRGNLVNSHFKKLVPVEIVDEHGKIIASTISMSSGRFKLTDLPGGLYFIRVSPKFLLDNSLITEPESLAVDLNGKAGIRNAGSLMLYRKSN